MLLFYLYFFICSFLAKFQICFDQQQQLVTGRVPIQETKLEREEEEQLSVAITHPAEEWQLQLLRRQQQQQRGQ